jgi:hypothetical protein
MKMPFIGFERKLNLLIGTPDMGVWTSEFGKSLCNMMTYLMSKPVPGYREQSMKPMQVHGSLLPRARGKLFQEAIAGNFTHLLFIDADQEFPRDTAHRLLEHRKDVVACNIATKQIPASTTARTEGGVSGIPVYTDKDSPTLERVWRVGTGIMLLDVRVCKRIGPGVFEIRWKPELQDYQGEDWSLCEALQGAGYQIWVDHRLSDEVKHVGKYSYDMNVVGEKQWVEEQEPKMIGEV